ncbi:hypothetical protein C0J52_18246 [Blattella germanica]|nr:hypothetical protein C0J52_18246 [Blattella germanica]
MGRSGYTCVRHVFCTLNVIMWLCGCGILGVGIWLRLSYSGYTQLLPKYSLISADSLCIAVGVIIFVVAFFGCCGSWFQSRCMLITYFSLVIFMFLVEFLFATLAFVFRENLGSTLREELTEGIRVHYNTSDSNSIENIWTHIHNEIVAPKAIKICGIVLVVLISCLVSFHLCYSSALSDISELLTPISHMIRPHDYCEMVTNITVVANPCEGVSEEITIFVKEALLS